MCGYHVDIRFHLLHRDGGQSGVQHRQDHHAAVCHHVSHQGLGAGPGGLLCLVARLKCQKREYREREIMSETRVQGKREY